nr:MAG TPA: hypothetical protein [Caudoviricetes sp.]
MAKFSRWNQPKRKKATVKPWVTVRATYTDTVQFYHADNYEQAQNLIEKLSKNADFVNADIIL